MDTKYETIDWDEDWSELYAPLLAYNENMTSKNPKQYPRSVHETIGDKYYKHYVESPYCRSHAERLLKTMRDENPNFDFAAHTNASYGRWVVLVRKKSKAPLSSSRLMRIQRNGNAILREIEKDFPDEATKREEARIREGIYSTGRINADNPGGCLVLIGSAFALSATVVWLLVQPPTCAWLDS
ncbi:MAG: hypothetical protein NXI32_30520 [bacterium]|nr:hypothetical protein [bacterium]